MTAGANQVGRASKAKDQPNRGDNATLGGCGGFPFVDDWIMDTTPHGF